MWLFWLILGACIGAVATAVALLYACTHSEPWNWPVSIVSSHDDCEKGEVVALLAGRMAGGGKERGAMVFDASESSGWVGAMEARAAHIADLQRENEWLRRLVDSLLARDQVVGIYATGTEKPIGMVPR